MNLPRLTPRILAALLIFCAVIAYIPVIGAGYIWDDDILLTANPQVHDAHGLSDIWHGKNSREYTPLATTSFRLEWKLWGDAPMGYHIVNILLHALSALLLWQVLLALGIPGAWLAALLFAVHPVSVASVAWIAERKNTLSAVFFLASVLAFLHAQKRNTYPLYITSVLCFLLAGFAKGAVVTLPAVLFGCLIWQNGKITRRDLLRLVPFGLIALLIAWFTIRYQSRAEHYGLLPDTLQFRIARAGMAVCWYLKEIIFPLGLSPIAPAWDSNLDWIPAWLSVGVVVAILAICFRPWKNQGRPHLFAFAYFLGMLLPVLGFVWMTLQQETIAADWWQYMAAPGIFALFAAAFTWDLQRAGDRGLAMQVTLGVIIALLLVQTWRRCATYQSMETYCAAVVAEDPHAWTLQNNLGIVLKQKGDYRRAIAAYRQALADNPKYVEARYNLANALSASGNLPDAEAEYLAALQLRPESPDIQASLAETYFHENKLREAIAAQAAALKADRANPQRYVRFGIMLAANKQYTQAVVCFQNALFLDPADMETRVNLIRGLLATGRREEAAALCRESLQTAQKSGNEKTLQIIRQLLEQSTR